MAASVTSAPYRARPTLLALAYAHPMVVVDVENNPHLRVVAASATHLLLEGCLDLTTVDGLIRPLKEALAENSDVELISRRSTSSTSPECGSYSRRRIFYRLVVPC